MATQLSDALELATGSNGVAQIAAARQSMQSLLLDTKGSLDALAYNGCVVWASADPSALGRLLSGVTQRAAEHPSPKSLRLLVPVESFG